MKSVTSKGTAPAARGGDCNVNSDRRRGPRLGLALVQIELLTDAKVYGAGAVRYTVTRKGLPRDTTVAEGRVSMIAIDARRTPRSPMTHSHTPAVSPRAAVRRDTVGLRIVQGPPKPVVSTSFKLHDPPIISNRTFTPGSDSK